MTRVNSVRASLKISVVSYQKHARSDCEEAAAEYVKRVSPHAEIELHSIRKWTSATGVPEKLLQRGRLIGLFVDGTAFTSENMAQRLQELMNSGHSRLVFLIGGAEGMPEKAAQQVHERWSLSKLTFSHQMAKLILLEALYRSFDILHGGNYHK